MVAHNNDHDRDVFQISPGDGAGVAVAGVAGAPGRRGVERSGAGRGTSARPPRLRLRGRSGSHGATTAPDGRRTRLRGEVRLPIDPRSTLYNTDGQIFSDAGVPVVLFMENYDINRKGYHDTHDTMENIDLDYGAAVAAIAIETVARAATEEPPG